MEIGFKKIKRKIIKKIHLVPRSNTPKESNT